MSNVAKASNNPFDIFVIGARKGFHIAINNLMPNVLMAYVISEMLNRLGIMELLGHLFAPLMGLLGLPGQSVTVLLTSWLSCSAGTGVAMNLLIKGTLNTSQITVLAPAIFLMGSQVQYMGRLLGVADVPKKYWPLLMLTSILNSIIAMIIMHFVA
jgi:spore maturation protein SpmB